MQAFAEWLQDTRFSETLSAELWIVPTLQSIHIISASLVFGAALMIAVRLISGSVVTAGLSGTAKRFIPWIWGGLLALTFTGSLQVGAEPTRALLNGMFQLKMALMVLAIAITAYFQFQVAGRIVAAGEGGAPTTSMRISAILTIVLWVAIIICARWIAYVE